MHVVSSNKAALSSPINTFHDIIAATRKTYTTFKFESCVYAGLPVINMMRDILDTGDVIKKVTGVISGTLSLIFNSMRVKFDNYIWVHVYWS
jgi:homoserine dehydrogenase